MSKYAKISIFIFSAVCLIALDQISKYLIRSKGGFYVCNPNIAFGIEFNQFLFYATCFLVVLYLLISGNSKFKAPNPKQIPNSNVQNPKFLDFGLKNLDLFRIWNLEFGILLILSGAIGNILDRIQYGCVIDFFDLKFWPVFNTADIFITLGAIILILKFNSRTQESN